MPDIGMITKTHQNAEARWARFGPYYAMFPVEFAFDVVRNYSNEGDYILDPFAGRGSSVYAGGVLGRHSLGIEINPVGWLYGKVKLHPAPKEDVILRLSGIYSKRNLYSRRIEKMSLFYRMCFCDEVLKFLWAVRTFLNWKTNSTDATLMAIILSSLQGKIGEGLSNQMKMTKSMGVSYSINWWKNKGLEIPPSLNPYDFLLKKIEWRYAKGIPIIAPESKIIYGDSTEVLRTLSESSQSMNVQYSLLFTSPPYCAITDYHADQWLRLWLLGGSGTPKTIKEKHKGRFNNKTEYSNLLDSIFAQSAKMMGENAVIYIRTDARQFTLDTTNEILDKYFYDYHKETNDKPVAKRTQTDVLGNKSSKKGEVDIILTRGKIS
jgi:DNA modification methylase